MGSGNSKPEKTPALRLCKERKRLIKEAIDSRYALAAAHVSYIQSLRNIGVSLRRFAEAEMLIEFPLSISDKTPSHCSYPSPSTSQFAEVSDSPSPNVSRLSYMKLTGSSAVTLRYNPATNTTLMDDDDDVMGFTMPPPPPPLPPDSGGSWDYFEPGEVGDSFRFVGHNGSDEMLNNSVNLSVKDGSDLIFGGLKEDQKEINRKVNKSDDEQRIHGSDTTLVHKDHLENSDSKRMKPVVEKDLCEEREDPSEFITHRAKDFLSSIKDIEHRFIRASESGKEVARMLEANKIRVGYADAKVNPSASDLLAACNPVCCRGKSVHASHEPPQQMTKVIIWNRSLSSHSSSSRNPLATGSKNDADYSGSDYVEELCMISGSHYSTLDRLYAWERKLYDEVKASEVIRKEYDRKCNLLRHQFAKDMRSQVIDKTRATVKDLHSRILVSLHAVDSISKRIEKMRDEELQPQLTELIQGFIRMWKAMLECHHAQYITISLAYHAKTSKQTPAPETHREIMSQLQYEFECFGLSFANWTSTHTKYIDALNGWLQNCILHPQERSKNRRPFSPRRALAPPIFVLLRDWSLGIKALPSGDVNDAIKTFLSDIHSLIKQQPEERKEDVLPHLNGSGELEGKDEERKDGESSNLSFIQSSLTRVLDKLTKFSEASLKLYEEIRQKSEAACVAYLNPRPTRF